MHVVRDLLDKQLVDSRGRKMGRVDGLAMEVGDGAQPSVTVIRVGGAALTRRLPGVAGRWLTALGRRYGVNHGEPFSIPWSKVTLAERVVRVEVSSDESAAMAGARWVRDHIVGRLPGAGS